jgi:hypothetical protein
MTDRRGEWGAVVDQVARELTRLNGVNASLRDATARRDAAATEVTNLLEEQRLLVDRIQEAQESIDVWSSGNLGSEGRRLRFLLDLRSRP